MNRSRGIQGPFFGVRLLSCMDVYNATATSIQYCICANTNYTTNWRACLESWRRDDPNAPAIFILMIGVYLFLSDVFALAWCNTLVGIQLPNKTETPCMYILLYMHQTMSWGKIQPSDIVCVCNKLDLMATYITAWLYMYALSARLI